MLKWIAVILLGLGAIVAFGWFVYGELSSQVPTPEPEYQTCLQRHASAQIKNAGCKPTESVWERTRADPTSYFTVWLTGFTGILAIVGIIEGLLILDQIRLGREEFEASHRPWIAIRDVAVTAPAIHVDALRVEVTIQYVLENTSDVPALDVMLVGVVVPTSIGETALRRVVSENIASYGKLSEFERRNTQNQIIFPGETTDPAYRSTLPLVWRDGLNDKDLLSPASLRDILVVAAFFYATGSKQRRAMYSACVHEVRSNVTDLVLATAKAGTGVSLNASIDRWGLGWSAI